MISAYQKYKVVFDDKSEKITDRFDLVARFKDLLIEDDDGILIYNGESFNFKAYPIN